MDNQHSSLPVDHARSECLFTQLLRECSVDHSPPEFLSIENLHVELSRESTRRQISDELPIEEFELWRGLENAEDEQTETPEPHLTRAKSLRVEQ